MNNFCVATGGIEALSKIVQEHAFKIGYIWSAYGKSIEFTKAQFLVFDAPYILWNETSTGDSISIVDFLQLKELEKSWKVGCAKVTIEDGQVYVGGTPIDTQTIKEIAAVLKEAGTI